jgi:hypothetical protein
LAACLLAGCNPSIESASEDFNSLPPAVQKTVRADAPDAEITSVRKTTEPAGPLGKAVKSVDRALAPTGAVGTQFSALPEPVQKTIQQHAPTNQIADISRHEDNNRVIYEVEFKDQGKNPSIRVAEDGSLVQDLQK